MDAKPSVTATQIADDYREILKAVGGESYGASSDVAHARAMSIMLILVDQESYPPKESNKEA